MTITYLDIINIISMGGKLIIDASKYSALDLKNIASYAKNEKRNIILKNLSKLTIIDLKNIASNGNGYVTLDLVE